MIYLLFFGLGIVTFLVMLNGFLRGAKKQQIDAVLSLILVCVLLMAFVALGWKTGLLAILFAFVCASATRPIAARVAARLLALSGGPSGTYIGLPPRSLARISRDLGRQLRPEEMMRELMAPPSRRERAEEALLDYCMGQPQIQSIMREFGADRSTLKELYSQLCLFGAGQWAGGHWVAASALAYPHTLRFLLRNWHTGASHMEQVYSLIMHFERGAPLP